MWHRINTNNQLLKHFYQHKFNFLQKFFLVYQPLSLLLSISQFAGEHCGAAETKNKDEIYMFNQWTEISQVEPLIRLSASKFKVVMMFTVGLWAA